MISKTNIFKILAGIVGALIALLIFINVIYIKTACATKECFIVNVASVLLLIWIVAFWFTVLKYLKEK